jgi:Curli production assembly/transport component CsgG
MRVARLSVLAACCAALLAHDDALSKPKPAPAPAPAPAPPPAPEPARDEVVDVAVLYFGSDHAPEDLVALRKGLAQMVISDLSGGPYRIVERERIEEVLKELDLSQTKYIDPSTAQRVGKALGADIQIVGGFFALGDALRIDAKVVHTERIQTVCSTGVTGTRANVFELERRLALYLRDAIPQAITGDSTKCPAPLDSYAGDSVVPAAAVAKLSAALDAKDQGDIAGAQVILQELVKEEPDFSVAAEEWAKVMK